MATEKVRDQEEQIKSLNTQLQTLSYQSMKRDSHYSQSHERSRIAELEQYCRELHGQL